MYAAGYDSVKCIDFLLRSRASLLRQDQEGTTALHFACRFGAYNAARVLVKAGAPLNALDNSGRASLHWAVECDGVETLAVLLKDSKHYCIDVKDGNGRTPLMLALELDRDEHARLLLKCGASTTLQSEIFGSLIHLCIARNSLKSIRLLAQTRPEILTMRDSAGLTGLLMAAVEGRLKLWMQF